jgi:hypothetical protein
MIGFVSQRENVWWSIAATRVMNVIPLTAFKKMIQKYKIDLQRAMRIATFIAKDARLVCGWNS